MKMSKWAQGIMEQKYSHDVGNRKETWSEISHRVAVSVMAAVGTPQPLTEQIETAIRDRKFIPGGRYLAAAGRGIHQTQNCLALRAEDSREGWADLLHKSTMSLMTGAGIGTNYSSIRPEGSIISKTGGIATGPIALMQMLNEVGRGIRQGGSRRAALWAGLSWGHADIFKFIAAKDWDKNLRALKAADVNYAAPLDGTNISVCLNSEFFDAYGDRAHPRHDHAKKVYRASVRRMLETGEPGLSVDIGPNEGEDLANACTEFRSRDDSDICNLGSINMARVGDLEEMGHLVNIGTAFLLAGSVYSDVPYAKVAEVRTRNRRLGLGLMGLHEWLLMHGRKYGPDPELEKYLQIYATSQQAAGFFASAWNLTRPLKTRAVAPNGTTGICAETTTGIEPIFCVAYKRRYLKGATVNYQYVVDPTAKRLIESGVAPELVEDAYSLSGDVGRRLEFQAWVQGFVDHAISSTINLPAWGTPTNNEDTVKAFGNLLMRYLPRLRGVTVYPDGARSGQPMVSVRYQTAVRHEGEVFVEQADSCDLTRAGTCG